jgi:hypothetical protein
MHSRLQAPSPKAVFFFCQGCQPTLDGHNISVCLHTSFSILLPFFAFSCIPLSLCLCLCAPPSYRDLKRPYIPSPPRASRYRDLMLCVIFASRQNLRIIGEIQVTLRPLTLERRGCHRGGLSRQPARRPAGLGQISLPPTPFLPRFGRDPSPAPRPFHPTPPTPPHPTPHPLPLPLAEIRAASRVLSAAETGGGRLRRGPDARARRVHAVSASSIVDSCFGHC